METGLTTVSPNHDIAYKYPIFYQPKEGTCRYDAVEMEKTFNGKRRDDRSV